MGRKDSDLVIAIKKGDEKAFEKLFFKYYEMLCRFAFRYVGSMDIAEEFVQEVFAKVWEIRNELSSSVNIRSYLYKATKNQALDYLKHEDVIQRYEQEVELRLYDDVYEIEEKFSSKEHFVQVAQNAIEELPDHTRHIYKMSRNDGLTYREIANVLDISIKTVESHISKALRILRDRLGQFMPLVLLVCLLSGYLF